MRGVFETKDGERYLKIEHYDIIPFIGDFKVQMTGIFPDPELSKTFAIIQIENYCSF